MFDFVKGLIRVADETITGQGTVATPAGPDAGGDRPLSADERAELEAFRGVKSDQDAADKRVADRNAAQHDPIPAADPGLEAQTELEREREQRIDTRVHDEALRSDADPA